MSAGKVRSSCVCSAKQKAGFGGANLLIPAFRSQRQKHQLKASLGYIGNFPSSDCSKNSYISTAVHKV